MLNGSLLLILLNKNKFFLPPPQISISSFIPLSKAKCLVCGGGRKNKYLIEILKKNLNIKELVSIDEYGHDGDFIESEAFAYLAIRSYLGLPISFPNTTRCKEASTGGVIVKNY